MTKNNPSGVVAKRSSLPATVEAMRQQLKMDAGLQDSNVLSVFASIQDRILRADTVESVLEAADAGTTQIEDVVDRPLEFLGYQVHESAEQYKSDASTGFYMLVSAVDLLSGVEHVLSTSGETLIAVFHRVMNLPGGPGFPFRASFYTRQTSSGFNTFKIRPLNEMQQAAVTGK
jgi:hypothetical protein